MVLCGVASEAVAQSGFTPAPNQVSAGNIDVRLSRVYVRIGRLGWDHEHAAEGRLLAGNVQLGARDGAGELVFDAASFIADTQDARGQFNLPGTVHDGVREKVTQQIFSPAGLDADRFPQAVFRIRSSLPSGAPRADGGGEYQLEGELSLRGINRPLRIAVFVEPVNDLWRLRGEGKIKLSDFGMSLPKRNLRMPTETLTHGAETLAVEGDVWMRR
jgi:hypothetical protein